MGNGEKFTRVPYLLVRFGLIQCRIWHTGKQDSGQLEDLAQRYCTAICTLRKFRRYNKAGLRELVPLEILDRV